MPRHLNWCSGYGRPGHPSIFRVVAVAFMGERLLLCPGCLRRFRDGERAGKEEGAGDDAEPLSLNG